MSPSQHPRGLQQNKHQGVHDSGSECQQAKKKSALPLSPGPGSSPTRHSPKALQDAFTQQEIQHSPSPSSFFLSFNFPQM